jgi:hypothetical protein
MTIIHPDKLVIVIEDNEPCDRLQWILQAMAAAMRHYARNPDRHHKDDEHAEVLSELMEHMVNVKNA